jgi:lysophospholipase L1-like esterase
MNNKIIVGLFCLALIGCHKSTAAPIILHAGDIIVAEGDSLTYGQDFSPTGHAIQQPFNGTMNNRSNAPYPETLQKLLGDKVTVINHGFPGDKTVTGITRWSNDKGGNLTLILFGTNDAWHADPTTPLAERMERYTDALKILVKRRQQEGAKIILIVPPPLENMDKNNALLPYQDAVRKLGKDMGVMVVDLPRDLATIPNMWVDGVHLSPSANQRIATVLAEKIRVE